MANIQTLLRKKPDQAAQHAKSNSHQQQFHLLWQKIGKAEKSYEAAKRQRRRIFEQFNDELQDFEQQCSVARFQLVEKLLPFLNKKSLPKYIKYEIIEWVQEEIEFIQSSPFRDKVDLPALLKEVDETLTMLVEDDSSHVELTAQEFKVKRKMMSEMLDQMGIASATIDDEQMEKFIHAMEKSPLDFMQIMAEYMQNSATPDDDDDNLDDDDATTEQYSHSQHEHFDQGHCHDPEGDNLQHHRKKNTFSLDSIHQLYKKLAQKFHPDRAKNEQDKAKCHELMLELTKAKKNNDAFTIFSLYQTYAGDDDFEFTEKDMISINRLLQEKLEAIRHKKRELKYDNSVESMVYEKFHASSKAKIQRAFDDHKKLIKTMIVATQHTIGSAKSIKNVKALVQARLDEKQQNMGYDDIFGMLHNHQFDGRFTDDDFY